MCNESNIKIHIRAEWDDKANVWFARSDDIAGLALEASTLDELESRLKMAVPELIELNGINGDGFSHQQIPFSLHAEKESCLSV